MTELEKPHGRDPGPGRDPMLDGPFGRGGMRFLAYGIPILVFILIALFVIWL